LLTSARLAARPGTAIFVISLALAGCGKSDFLGGALSGGGSPESPSTSIQSPGISLPPSTVNHAPSISGVPPSTVKVNQFYDFTPKAFDSDGDLLRFEITGKPSWASFNANTGRLYGSPPTGTSGTFGGIVIKVTDGALKSALGTFSIMVLVSAPVVSGPVALKWTRPATNTDGKPLTNLAGYRVYYGTNPSQPASVQDITDPSATSTSINGLTTGTWYFSISSYNTLGTESVRSNPVSIVIG
jgi:hypothetical protein